MSPAPAPNIEPRPLLRGQKALVTGANSGIGRATAIALGQAGADVVVNYVTGEDRAEAVVEEIRRGGARAYAHCADVSDEGQVKEMFRRMLAELGTIDILVNNAGRQKDARFVDMTLADWNAVLSVNLTGQFLCAREAVREFLRRGVVASVSCSAGKIICMSSVHETIPWAAHARAVTSASGRGEGATNAIGRRTAAAMSSVPTEIPMALAFFRRTFAYTLDKP